MLIRSFNLKDIREYEDRTGNNILSFFNEMKISNIIDLISLGNGNCDYETASVMLDDYLESGKTLVDAMLEIRELLLGKTQEESDDDSDYIKLDNYNSLTELYITFGMQLMSVGLAYNEFWQMNTKEMYRVFNSICIKMQNETNRELSNYHTLAAMIGGAVWGKLQKEPPRVNLEKNRGGDVEDMDVETAILVAKLKALGKKKGVENG